MNSASAFVLGEMHKDKEPMVFDWLKAAKILAKKKPKEAIAGLSSDMEWTSGAIWRNGKPVPKDDTYTYLASTWATPVLEIDGEEIPCFIMQSEKPEWDSGTYWPDEAVAVVAA